MKSRESFSAINPKRPHGLESTRVTADEQESILAQFSPEERRTIVERQRLLSSLGFFIGKDFDMPILLNESGAGWHWNFKENHIKIDPKDLLEKPLDYLRFVISHEGGHRRISRTEFIPEDVWRQPGFSFMMNAIEDPRDNNFVAEAYPKFREQMNLAYTLDQRFEAEAKALAQKRMGSVPRFLQAGHEYIKQWFREANGKPFEIDPTLPQEVQDAVKETLAAARSSWWRYPSKQEADRSEELITRYAESSYRINLEKVWPEFKRLVDEDTADERTRQALDDMQKGQPQQGGEDEPSDQKIPQELGDGLTPQERQELEGTMREAQDQDGAPKPIDPNKLSPELKKKIEEYIDSLPDDKKRELAERARQAIKEIEDEINTPLEPKFPTEEMRPPVTRGLPPLPPLGHDRYVDPAETKQVRDKLHELMEKDTSAYGRVMREVLPLIDRLEDDLREIFVERRARKWETGHKFGKKIDLKKRMQEKVQGVSAVESRAWQRREAPQEKDYAISLLVDLSGSMHGRKIEETFKAAVVLCEVLNKLSIKNEILGFNDRIHEFKRFDEAMSDEVRESMGAMLNEVTVFAEPETDERGNPKIDSRGKVIMKRARAAYNDDGWALRQASDRLARQDADEKFLMDLSDGLPAPSPQHSGSEFGLKQVVGDIMTSTDQKLVGLGIGAGTKHVEDYYPNSLADVAVAEMADRLADLLREVIANYQSF